MHPISLREPGRDVAKYCIRSAAIIPFSRARCKFPRRTIGHAGRLLEVGLETCIRGSLVAVK